MKSVDRKLRVFLCHSSQDKPIVRELYQRLNAEGWIDSWLDEEKLLPGQDWDMEIEKAVEAADAVIVCLSTSSVTKEGYVQRELKFALEIALEKPEGTIFIIPVRLDECQIPRRIRSWQYVDYFPAEHKRWAYQRLIESLQTRCNQVIIRDTGESVHGAAEEVAKFVTKEQYGKKREEELRATDKKTREEADQQEMTAKDKLVFDRKKYHEFQQYSRSKFDEYIEREKISGFSGIALRRTLLDVGYQEGLVNVFFSKFEKYLSERPYINNLIMEDDRNRARQYLFKLLTEYVDREIKMGNNKAEICTILIKAGYQKDILDKIFYDSD